jgi:hypothetical protein
LLLLCRRWLAHRGFDRIIDLRSSWLGLAPGFLITAMSAGAGLYHLQGRLDGWHLWCEEFLFHRIFISNGLICGSLALLDLWWLFAADDQNLSPAASRRSLTSISSNGSLASKTRGPWTALEY